MSGYRRFSAICLLVNVLAHVLLLLKAAPPLLHSLASFYSLALAPGLLLAPLLLRADRQTWALPERLLLGAGAGSAMFLPITLLLSYWPGPLTLTQLLLTFDAIALTAALVGWQRDDLEDGPSCGTPLAWTRWSTLALLSVLLLTAYFRLANLGYAELQGDEAKVVLHAIAAVQGDEEVLFLHRRGPGDVLPPAAIAALDMSLTEGALRLPFALISILVVGLAFLLARAVRSDLAAWLAGLLLASEGLFIAFARIVQYQAFIHLSAVGTLYLLFLLHDAVVEARNRVPQPLANPGSNLHTDSPQDRSAGLLPWYARQTNLIRNYLLLAALFFTAGLLAHYEAIVIVPAAAYLLWRMVRNGLPLRVLARAAALPAALSAGILAAFYVPFLLHPRFQETLTRYSEKVVGDMQRFFDHLALFVERGVLYNLHVGFWIMLLVLALYPLQAYWRTPRLTMRAIGLAGMLAMLAALAGVWSAGDVRDGVTPLLVGGFVLVAVLAPKATPGERMLWLWLGPALFLSLFLIRDPNLHFYIFFTPWAIVVAIVLDGGWRLLRSLAPLRLAQVVAGALVLLCLLPRLAYAQRLFISHDVEIQRNWTTQDVLPGWMMATDPAGHPIFGFPHNSGWKTVGVLYDAGVLQGSYATNIRDWVSAWYTRGAELCEEESDWVIIETGERPENQAELRALMGDRYVKRGEIYVGERLGIELYGRNQGDAGPVVRYQAEDDVAHFDATLADAALHAVVPELDPALDALYYRFGDQLALTGYRLHDDQVASGESLSLLLRWEALAPPDRNFAVFTQVLDGDARKLGQRDTDVACNAGPTSAWAAGDAVVAHYRIPLDPAAPSGDYPLLFGLYERETGERLPIFDRDGNALGDALSLSQITVAAPQGPSRRNRASRWPWTE